MLGPKQLLMVRTFLKVYIELGSYFLFLQEQINGIIITAAPPAVVPRGLGISDVSLQIKSVRQSAAASPVLGTKPLDQRG